MKRKQGFTLVELLAVIVVLAVIALIATPTILGVIDKTKKGALKNSAYGLIEAATLYYAQNGVVGTERFELDQENKLSYKGSVESGTVLINSKGKIMVCVNDGDNAAYKNYSDTNVAVVSGKTCNVNASETQVLLDGENTIDEYTNQELTELVDALQTKIDELETEISTLKENKTDVSTTTTLEEVVNTKADLTSLATLSSQHTTDINRIDNSILSINSKIGANDISSIGDGTITGAINALTEVKSAPNVITTNLENVTNNVNYIKTNGTSVNLVYTITDITETITPSMTIATVPEEYRPPFQSFLMGFYVKSDGTMAPMLFSVNNDGRIVQNTHTSFSPLTMSFSGTYPLAVK